MHWPPVFLKALATATIKSGQPPLLLKASPYLERRKIAPYFKTVGFVNIGSPLKLAITIGSPIVKSLKKSKNHDF